MKNEVTHSIHAETLHKVIGIQHISLGLTHFAVALQQPRMTENLFWQWNIQRHQHNWPIQRMETQNIFSNQMKICRPIFHKFFIVVSVYIITKSCDVVAESINPHVYYVVWIEVHWDSPFETGTGNTKILKSRFQEVIYHLIFSGFRLNEFRMFLDVFHETILIFAQFQEISFFFCRLTITTAIRAFAIGQLRWCEEGFTWCTIHSFVMSFVNISLLVQFLEQFLNLYFVVRVCGTDKFIIRSIH